MLLIRHPAFAWPAQLQHAGQRPGLAKPPGQLPALGAQLPRSPAHLRLSFPACLPSSSQRLRAGHHLSPGSPYAVLTGVKMLHRISVTLHYRVLLFCICSGQHSQVTNDPSLMCGPVFSSANDRRETQVML